MVAGVKHALVLVALACTVFAQEHPEADDTITAVTDLNLDDGTLNNTLELQSVNLVGSPCPGIANSQLSNSGCFCLPGFTGTINWGNSQWVGTCTRMYFS